MPIDMKAALAQKRAERLAKSGPASSAPSLLPKKLQKVETPKEPPPPTIEELEIDGKVEADDVQTLHQLVAEHARIGEQERELEVLKKPLTDRIKKLVDGNEALYKMLVGTRTLEYYPVNRATITAASLLEAGAQPSMIAAATKSTTSWTLKIR